MRAFSHSFSSLRHLASSPSSKSLDVNFMATDFFAYTVPLEERFDLVYDYTYVILPV